MDLGLYFKKRTVEAESSASSRKEVTERTYVEILKEDQEARKEIVEIQEEEDRQEETVEIRRRGWRCQTDGDSGYSGRRE